MRGEATSNCLDWLAGQLELRRPTVIFLMEIQGGLSGAKAMRKWWRRRGYDMVFLPSTSRNAIVCAVDRREARTMRHERVAPRVLGVTVRVRGVQGDVRLACIHGVHDPHIFQRQWADGEQWVARGAGMLCGDLNHVPCMAWRVNNRSLDWADKAIRSTLGHTCDCCSTAMDSEENRVLLLVPAPRDAAHGHWTHYFTSQGLWGEPNARYDFAISATEAPAWRRALPHSRWKAWARTVSGIHSRTTCGR